MSEVIHVESKVLKDAIARVSGIPPASSPIDDYKFIYLSATKDNVLAIVGHSSSVFAQTTCPCEAEAFKGAIAIPAKKAAQLTTVAADKSITFKRLKTTTNVSAGTNWAMSLRIAAVSKRRPPTPDKNAVEMTFIASEIVDGVADARYAPGFDELSSRFSTSSIALDFRRCKEPAIVGCCSTWMTTEGLTPKSEYENGPLALIPVASGRCIERFFRGMDGQLIYVRQSGNWLYLRGDAGIICCLEEGGRYPNWRNTLEQTVPPGSPGVRANRKELLDSVNRAMFTLDPKVDESRIEVSAGTDIGLKCKSQEYGESFARCNCDNDTDAEFTTGVNALRFRIALGNLEGDMVDIYCSDGGHIALAAGRGRWMLGAMDKTKEETDGSV